MVIDCGFHEGWSTPTIPKFNGEDPLSVTSDEIAWMVNLMYVGVGIGSLIPFILMNNIGRKGTLLVTTMPKIASWLFIGLSTSARYIFVGRVLAGIGCGVTYAVMPMYLGEISSKRTRGPLGTTTLRHQVVQRPTRCHLSRSTRYYRTIRIGIVLVSSWSRPARIATSLRFEFLSRRNEEKTYLTVSRHA